MIRTKHFTLLEIGSDLDSPMIGTIDNVFDTHAGRESFRKRFLKSVAEHFDKSDFNYDEINLDVFFNDISSSTDIMIEFEGTNKEVQIVETWMY